MFTEMLTAYRALQAGPKTYQDLLDTINAFAAKHQATPDVFFEVLFNHLYNRIKDGVGSYSSLDEVEARELLYLEKFSSRPRHCAVMAAPSVENCRLYFNDLTEIGAIMGGHAVANEAIKNMLAVFVTDNMFPGYKYNKFTPFGMGSGKLNFVRKQLFPENSDPNLEEQEDQIEQELKSEAERLEDLRQQATLADWYQECRKSICNFIPNCEMPNKYYIDFLNSPAAEQAIARIKADAILWRAYNIFMPDVSIGLSTNDIGDPTNLVLMLSFDQMVEQANATVANYNLNCTDCDIFEHALAKMYDAGEKPLAACKFVPNFENYAGMKRDFAIRISISKEAMQRMVDNINARNPKFPNAAVLVNEFPATMLLSYAFVFEDFLPRLEGLLNLNPELVAEMQAVVNARRAAHLESIDEGKDEDIEDDIEDDETEEQKSRIRRAPSI